MWLRRVGIEQDVAEAARKLLAGRWSVDELRSRGEVDPRSHPAWSAVRDMGWLDMLLPEDHGGLGLGPVEAGAVFEECGRVLFPGPLFGTIVVGARCREEEALEAGSMVAFAFAEPASQGRPAWSATHFEGGVVSGTKHLVEDADAADTIVVVAGAGRGGPAIALVDAGHPSISRDDLASIDPARRVSALRFDRVPARVLGAEGGTRRWLADVEALAHCLYASRLLGVSDRLLEIATAHARMRVQFDRPIGAFQAVQHLLADLKVATTTARSVCYVSQAALAGKEPDAARRAHVAKGYLSLVGRRVAEGALQILGGVGFAAEHDLHLYYKHALSLQGAWGDEREHQDRLADDLLRRIRRQRQDDIDS